MSNQNSCPPTLNDASPEKGREAPATSPTLTTLTQKERERERKDYEEIRAERRGVHFQLFLFPVMHVTVEGQDKC